MAVEWLAPLIAGASNVAVGLGGTAMRNEAQKRESELAYRRQQEAIREQNAYNSASAQMARLQAAGLNPNLMYDNGQQAAAGMQDNIAEYQPAELENAAPAVGQLGSDFVSSVIGLKDMQNKTNLAEAEILTKASTRDLNTSNIHLNEAKAKDILECLGYKKDGLRFNAEYFRQKGITEDSIRKQLDMSTSELASRIVKNFSDVEVNQESIKKMEAEIGKLNAEQREILTLLSYNVDFLKASAAERYAACSDALASVVYKNTLGKTAQEQAEYFRKLGGLAEVNAAYIPKKLTQGYWKIGADTVVGVLGLVTKFFGKGMPMANMFGSSPWQQLENQSGEAYGEFLSGD